MNLRKLCFLFLALSLLSFKSFGQIEKSKLLGNWKLTGLINKQASEYELQKSYKFSMDTLFYEDPNRSIKGFYKLNKKTGDLLWYIAINREPLTLKIEYQTDTIIHLKQSTPMESVGVLKRN